MLEIVDWALPFGHVTVCPYYGRISFFEMITRAAISAHTMGTTTPTAVFMPSESWSTEFVEMAGCELVVTVEYPEDV